MMKFEYDSEVDAAYIYLVFPIKGGQATSNIQLNDNIILDFGKDGKLLGIEILNASKLLKKQVLEEAQIA